MKTTIEIPDAVFRRAKALAAEEGVSLKDLFTEAVQTRLRSSGVRKTGPSWEGAFGGLKDLHRENLRIAKVIEQEFEAVDEGMWQ